MLYTMVNSLDLVHGGSNGTDNCVFLNGKVFMGCLFHDTSFSFDTSVRITFVQMDSTHQLGQVEVEYPLVTQ